MQTYLKAASRDYQGRLIRLYNCWKKLINRSEQLIKKSTTAESKIPRMVIGKSYTYKYTYVQRTGANSRLNAPGNALFACKGNFMKPEHIVLLPFKVIHLVYSSR